MIAVKNVQEQQYLCLVQEIISRGNSRKDRTGTGTLSVFAPQQLVFNLDAFPLLTTKRVFIRSIFEELMWFIRGQTDNEILVEKGVTIWSANAKDSRDLGPIYGFQWRHFGADYTGYDKDYTNKGVDQLRQVINSILFNPTDRRIILSAWNPAALKDMALPPCHMFCQFYVGNGRLDCQLYQRSCDMGLGVPFNIASYSLLTCFLAHLTGLKPGRFIHCMGDAHVYLDHVDMLKVQLERIPRDFPTLEILKKPPLLTGNAQDVDQVLKALESMEFEDFKILGYQPHPKIQMNMSV